MRQKRLLKRREQFASRESIGENGSVKIVDLLKNSVHLNRNAVVKDLLAYGCDPKRIDPSISLP